MLEDNDDGEFVEEEDDIVENADDIDNAEVESEDEDYGVRGSRRKTKI